MSIRIRCPNYRCRKEVDIGTDPCPGCGRRLRERDGITYTVRGVDGEVWRDSKGRVRNGRRISFNLGQSLEIAQIVDSEIKKARLQGVPYKGMQTDPPGPVPSSVTLDAVKDSYFASAEYLSKREQQSRRSCIRRVVAMLGPATLAAALKPSDMFNYAEGRLKVGDGAVGVSPGTVRIETAYFNAMLTWAVRKGMLQENPIKGYSRPGRNASRQRLMSWKEYQAIASKMYLDHLAQFELRLRQGFRVREMLKIQVEDVILERRREDGRLETMIVVPEGISKSGKRRVVRIWWHHVVELLKAIIGTRKTGPLIESPMSAYVWRGILKRTGIQGLQERDIRATSLSVLALNGIPLHDLMDATDHSSLSMQHVYVRSGRNQDWDWPQEGAYNPASRMIEPLPQGATISPAPLEADRNSIG